MTDATLEAELNIREQLARIDHILADHQRIYADMRRIDADHDRKRQEIRHAPLIIGISLMTTGAALFAAGAAFIKIFG